MSTDRKIAHPGSHDWWEKLTPDQKTQFIEENPDVQYATRDETGKVISAKNPLTDSGPITPLSGMSSEAMATWDPIGTAELNAKNERFENWKATSGYTDESMFGSLTSWQAFDSSERVWGRGGGDPFSGPTGDTSVSMGSFDNSGNSGSGSGMSSAFSGTAETVLPDNETATGILRDTLKTYGLEALLDDEVLDLENLYVTLDDMPAVWAAVRQSAGYKERFPGMEKLSQAGRALSEAEYITVERSYAQTLNAYGMPAHFYDEPEDFATLIGGDVSPSEFANRVELAYTASKEVDSSVMQSLKDYYGFTEGDLTAYYLDPERATNIFEERERLGAAKFGGMATKFGSSITQKTAESLEQSGLTEKQARRGFQTIAQSTLDEETVSEQGDDITFDDLTQAEFDLDPEASRRREQRRQRRLADFSQSGGPLLTQGGYTGLGSAN